MRNKRIVEKMRISDKIQNYIEFVDMHERVSYEYSKSSYKKLYKIGDNIYNTIKGMKPDGIVNVICELHEHPKPREYKGFRSDFLQIMKGKILQI